MRLSWILVAAAIILALAVVGPGGTGVQAPAAHAQEEVDACQENASLRSIRLAYDHDNLLLIVGVAGADYTHEQGVPLRITHVLEGELEPGDYTTDIRPNVGCVARRLWTADASALALLLSSHGQFLTINGWPLVTAAGAPLSPSAIDAAAGAPGGLHVRFGDQIVTVAELLERGRNYVEPTPTPLPPGVPSPSPLTPLHGVTTGEQPPSAAPATGTGAAAPDSGDGGSYLFAGALIGLLAVAVTIGVGLAGRRRSGRG